MPMLDDSFSAVYDCSWQDMSVERGGLEETVNPDRQNQKANPRRRKLWEVQRKTGSGLIWIPL